MTKIIHILKKLLFILIIATTLLFSKEGFAQCDIDYYPTSNPNNTCLVAGNDITFNYPSAVTFFLWDSTHTTFIWYNSTASTNADWLSTAGTYIVDVMVDNGLPFPLDALIIQCTDTITIAPGIVSLPPNILLSYCQWNTINLEDTLNAYFLQNATNPQYTFTDIAGNPINGTNYYINTSGLTTINVTVLDASGCTDTEQIIIDAQANNINTQSYTISDTIIPFCENTTTSFQINDPDTTNAFTYNWTVDGTNYLDTVGFQHTFYGSQASPLPNPGIFYVTLTISDSTGCSVIYNTQITSLGMVIPTSQGSGMTFGDAASPGCAFDSTSTVQQTPSIYWIEVNNNGVVTPITEMGPLDTIFWSISCDAAAIANGVPDILDTFWVYSDLPDLIIPNPISLSNPDVAGLVQFWEENSCNCLNGEYEIYVDVQPGCGNDHYDVTVHKKVNDPVDAQFELPTPLCVGDTNTFQNASESGCDGLTFVEDTVSYIWDFGDCIVLSESIATSSFDPFPNITHAYSQAGIYNVTLTVVSFCGETDTAAQITVNPKPNVSFTFTDTICDNDLVSFNSNAFADSTYLRIDNCSLNPLDTNHITVPAGDTNFTYSWNFDDPNSLTQDTSSFPNPTHTFSACGTYYVTLLVSDNNGCDSLFTDTVIVYELPDANFWTPEVCEGTATCIIDNSTVNTTNGCYGAPIYNWEYFIADDITGLIIDTLYFDINDADADSCYLFTPDCDSTTESFTYTIELIVTDSLNCVDNRIKTTKVLCTPDADFDTIAVCQGETKQFTNLSSPLNGMSWEWVIDTALGNYAAGFDEFDRHPEFIFDTCGTFEITLFQIDPDTLLGSSCNDSVTKQIIVHCLPEASFTSDIICQGDSTELISTSLQGSQPSGPITDWNWSVNTINNDTNYHVFNNCDSTNVTLTVTDSASCTNTFNDNIFVKCNPIADIFAENQCFDNQPISFIDTSSDGTGTIDSWYWEITGGDYLTGDTSSTQYPSYTFDSCGIYTAYLTVNDSLECSNIDSINVEIYCLPEAIFSIENVCEDLVTPFDGSASTAIIDTFIWILSNGYTDTTTTPIWNDYQFSNCGNYSADLFVIDNHGCTDSSITMDFDVYCPPIANFEFDSVCEGTATAIWGTSQPGNSPSAPIDTWDWSFDGTTETDSSFTHTFSNCGPFPVTLTVSDTNNCTSPALPLDIFVKCNP
ncbi:MAG: PKD domain-containing protein, partial [Flavobacteriales bacterium]